MSRRKNRLYVAAGFLLLAAIIGITSQQEVRSQGNPNPVNAKIINTAAQPVPTALSSSSNTIKLDQSNNTVQARQLNAWSVGITGTPTVQVGNTATSPALVHEVENAARQPFMTTVSLPLSVGQTSGTVAVIVGAQVPLGKLLVIEHASIAVRVPRGQKAFVTLSAGSFGGGATDFFTLESQCIWGGDERFTTS